MRAEAIDDRAMEEIGRAIGDARVVMLGELTHGDGAWFALKTELVKRLHREYGFEVLIWESGLFDCEEMDRALAGTGDVRQAARAGVFPHWSQSSEAFPVFEYARGSARTPKPLRMTGFDIQESGTASWGRWPTYMEWIGAGAGLDAEVLRGVQQALRDAAKIRDAPDPAKEQQRIQRDLRRLAGPIAEWYATQLRAHAAALGKRESQFRLQCLKSEARLAEMMGLYEEATAKRDDALMIQSYNLREEANADNLRWLLDTHYAGKKVLVWAHNVHISACGPTGTDLPGTRISTGKKIKRSLGSQVYAIGLVGYEGQWSWLDNPPISYARPGVGSLEEAWGATGAPAGFLDLRKCRGSGHWLMERRPGYLDQQSASLVEVAWPGTFDGVFFMRQMTPRRGLSAAPGR